MRTWVMSGVWSVSDGQFEDLWSRADDDTKRVNDSIRFEAEQSAGAETT